MKRLTQILVFLIFSAMIASCARDEIVDLDTNEADRTLIFYILADNNLSSYMLQNVIAAEKGVESGIPPTSRVVIYLDKSDTTQLFEIGYLPYGSNDCIKYSKCLKTYPKQYSTDPAVMRTVFSDIKTLAPSRNYSLVLSAHGTGWFPKSTSQTAMYDQRMPAARREYDFAQPENAKMTRAWGYDHDRAADIAWMSGQELAGVLDDFDIDCLFFDACFMSSIELLYDLRSSARYIVASPTEVMAAGFPYETIVPMILSDDPDFVQVAAKIVDIYRNTSFGGEHSSSIAVVDCSKLDALAEAVRAIYAGTTKSVDVADLQPLETMTTHAFYDMDDYMTSLTDSKKLLMDYREAFSRAVVFADNTTTIYSAYGYQSGTYYILPKSIALSGVSCYVPRVSSPVTLSLWKQTEWAKAIGADI